jgi:hypothetical protein
MFNVGGSSLGVTVKPLDMSANILRKRPFLMNVRSDLGTTSEIYHQFGVRELNLQGGIRYKAPRFNRWNGTNWTPSQAYRWDGQTWTAMNDLLIGTGTILTLSELNAMHPTLADIAASYPTMNYIASSFSQTIHN